MKSITSNKISENDQIIIYQTSDGKTQIDVRMENETVWLNAEQMALLFERDSKTIRKHIDNAIREELAGDVVVAKFATTTSSRSSSIKALLICFLTVFSSLSKS